MKTIIGLGMALLVVFAALADARAADGKIAVVAARISTATWRSKSAAIRYRSSAS